MYIANVFFGRIKMISLIYLSAAVIPPIILMKYIYNLDKVEREPPSVIIRLVISGVIASFLAMYPEQLIDDAIKNHYPEGTMQYAFLSSFLCAALVEETLKYLGMYVATWKSKEFNYTFDGVVYGVSAALGFAASENIMYVFSFGFSTAIIRAVTSIPGHACFGAIMGVYYGLARKQKALGRNSKSAAERIVGLVLAMFVHGIYDTCASMSSGFWTLLFIGVVVFIYFILFKRVKRAARMDSHIPGTKYDSFDGGFGQSGGCYGNDGYYGNGNYYNNNANQNNRENYQGFRNPYSNNPYENESAHRNYNRSNRNEPRIYDVPFEDADDRNDDN